MVTMVLRRAASDRPLLGRKKDPVRMGLKCILLPFSAGASLLIGPEDGETRDWLGDGPQGRRRLQLFTMSTHVTVRHQVQDSAAGSGSIHPLIYKSFTWISSTPLLPEPCTGSTSLPTHYIPPQYTFTIVTRVFTTSSIWAVILRGENQP